MIDGHTLIILLLGAVVAAYGGRCLAGEIAYRWGVRHRERMTRWQRRVQAGLDEPPGFEVKRSD